MKLELGKLVAASITVQRGCGILLKSDNSAAWSHDFDENSTEDVSEQNISVSRCNNIGRLYDQGSNASSSLPSDVMNCEAMSVPSTESGEWIDPRISHPAKARNLESNSEDGSSYVSGNTSSSVVHSTVNKYADQKQNDSELASSDKTNEQAVAEEDLARLPFDVAPSSSGSSGESYLKAPISAIGSQSREYTAESTVNFDSASQAGNHQSSSSNTANAAVSELLLACSMGEVGVVKHIIANPDIDMKLIINQAAADGTTTTNKFLKGGHGGSNPVSPLEVASRAGHLEVVKELLLVPDIDVNRMAVEGGWTPLTAASMKGHAAIVEHLLNHEDIDVNKQDSFNRTALVIACVQGYSSIVAHLVMHPQIDVNIENGIGITALMIVSEEGNLSAVEHLLAHPQINVNKHDGIGRTALMKATMKVHVSVVRHLLAHPQTDVNKNDEQGCTALMTVSKERLASDSEHLVTDSIVEQLLAHPQIDVNKQTHNRETALIFATREGHSSVVEQLLAHQQTDVNKQTDGGETALTIATKEWNPSIVEQLLAHPDIDLHQDISSGKISFLRNIGYWRDHHPDILRMFQEHANQESSFCNECWECCIEYIEECRECCIYGCCREDARANCWVPLLCPCLLCPLAACYHCYHVYVKYRFRNFRAAVAMSMEDRNRDNPTDNNAIEIGLA